MKIYNKIIPLIATVLCICSCGTISNSDPFAVSTKLEMRMSDLVYLGESEISCEYDTYLGFIRQLNKVNKEAYMPGNKVKLTIPQSGFKFQDKGMQLAAAKLMKEYPQARYFQIVMETKETDRMFLGSTTKRTAKVRAYKFK